MRLGASPALTATILKAMGEHSPQIGLLLLAQAPEQSPVRIDRIVDIRTIPSKAVDLQTGPVQCKRAILGQQCHPLFWKVSSGSDQQVEGPKISKRVECVLVRVVTPWLQQGLSRIRCGASGTRAQ